MDCVLREGVVLGLAALAAAPGVAAAGPLLPDLRERVPEQISIATDTTSGTPVYELVFDSGAENVGAGPLIVEGSGDGSGSDMTASQVIDNSAGPQTVRSGVGTLHFDTDPSHTHWHYQGFEAYTLTPAGGGAALAADQKVGFCLTDDYWANGQPPADAVFVDECGSGQQDAKSIEEGISVGWGDEYVPQKEGQLIDVSAVPAGYYDLVNRVNPSGALLESDNSNDASSALVRLSWPNGAGSAPAVDVLRSCSGSAACTLPPTAQTLGSSGVTAAGATVSGSLDGFGLPARYRFDYGRTAAYGQSTSWQTSLPPTATIAGLAPATTYHYRLVAETSAGDSFGADAAFTTGSAGGTGSPGTPQGPSRRLRIRSVRTAGGTVTLRVETASGGRLTATELSSARSRSPRLRGASRRIAHAGIWTLTLRPSAALKSLLARRGHLRVRISLAFVHAGAPTTHTVVTVTLRAARKPAACGFACLGV